MQGREEEYTYHFTTEDVAELSSAVSKVKHSGVSSEQDTLQVSQIAEARTWVLCHACVGSDLTLVALKKDDAAQLALVT